MASISSPVTLKIDADVANANITVTYSLTGSTFDIASGQAYFESCRLIGDDTGIVPVEDNVDDVIPGSSFSFFPNIITFANSLPVNRVRTKTLAKANLDEDAGADQDEIRAVVTLTPIPVSATTRESNQVVANF